MKICKKYSYSDRIRWRIRGLWLLLVLMLVYMVVIGELGLGDSRIMDRLAQITSRLLFFGGIGWVVWRLLRNKRLLEDRQLLRQEQLRERDEGSRYLHDKSGGIVWDALFVCLWFLTMTASMIHMPVFHALFGVLCLAVALKAGVWLFYRHCPAGSPG